MSPSSLFREVYKKRVIEAVLGSGRARRFHAYVDGSAADRSTRYGSDTVTTSFGSRAAALSAARNAVDWDIALQSSLRQCDPHQAVEKAEKAHSRATENFRRVQSAVVGKTRFSVFPDRIVEANQHLADASMRLERTERDLELAIEASKRITSKTEA